MIVRRPATSALLIVIKFVCSVTAADKVTHTWIHYALILQFFNDGPAYETALTDNDFVRARYVTEALSTADGDPSELFRSHRFEGDIANRGLNADTVDQFMHDGYDVAVPGPDGVMMNAIKNKYLMWPSRRIPYSISSAYSSYS